uniref:RING-type domain-containing protein n=1 Tax=Calcidiscus leptoporus TaxID=127549 RepID=A0A7S0NUA0_9EUKA|mmetsp:Transcript_25720/g.60026  ORF Transcript_25720/g.60026 Transcript_25720/m.60026 type:complete len:295 (+) Transcript_25720:31-915(+)
MLVNSAFDSAEKSAIACEDASRRILQLPCFFGTCAAIGTLVLLLNDDLRQIQMAWVLAALFSFMPLFYLVLGTRAAMAVIGAFYLFALMETAWQSPSELDFRVELLSRNTIIGSVVVSIFCMGVCIGSLPPPTLGVFSLCSTCHLIQSTIQVIRVGSLHALLLLFVTNFSLVFSFLAARLCARLVQSHRVVWKQRYDDAVKAGLSKQCWDVYHARLRSAYLLRTGRQQQPREHGPLCVICIESPPQAAFMPCAHRCACMECSQLLQTHARKDHLTLRCPFCGSIADTCIRIYEP